MVDQAISTILPNDHLTRKLLRRHQGLNGSPLEALLEQLCTESIYSLKDDFDRGIDTDLWVVRNMALAEHDPFGVLYGTSPEDDPNRVGGDNLIRTRLANFFPNRRAVLQTRAQVSGDGSHVEIGFVGYDTGDESPVATLNASGTVLRGAESFGIALRSPLVDGWNI